MKINIFFRVFLILRLFFEKVQFENLFFDQVLLLLSMLNENKRFTENIFFNFFNYPFNSARLNPIRLSPVLYLM